MVFKSIWSFKTQKKESVFNKESTDLANNVLKISLQIYKLNRLLVYNLQPEMD